MTRRCGERMLQRAGAILPALWLAGWFGVARAQAPDAPTPDLPASLPDVATLLPRDLSPWGMFLNADIIVKAVMIGLAFASLITWTVALAKGLEVVMARRRLRKDSRTLASSTFSVSLPSAAGGGPSAGGSGGASTCGPSQRASIPRICSCVNGFGR